MSRNPRTYPLARLGVASMLAALALCASSAVAQVCDEDAGDEDAGDEDGGLACEMPDSGAPPVDEPDASLPDGGDMVDAGGDTSEACSCETVERTGAGTIHVCTGARERYECRYLECESTIKRDQPCPTRSVELCCEMPSRGLYSQLYEDCDHPNCEAGFRAQCHDFGGAISEGACVVDVPASSDDDSSGGCSVRSGRSSGWSGAALWMLAIAIALTRRRR